MARLSVRDVGDGAGIENEDIRRAVWVDQPVPGSGELVRQNRRVGLVELAAMCLYGNCWPILGFDSQTAAPITQREAAL